MLPAYNTISVEECISRAKMELRISDTTEHDGMLEILVREGLGSLNCINQLTKQQCNLTADGCTMELPKGLVRFIALRSKAWKASDPADKTPRPICDRFIYADTDFLNSCGCSGNGFSDFRIGMQINKGFIHFNEDLGITEATIAYLGMWMDKDNKPVIFERFERALSAYACWKFTRSWDDKYTQYRIESYQREWINQKDFLRGKAVSDEFNQQKREISELMRALIVSPIVLY